MEKKNNINYISYDGKIIKCKCGSLEFWVTRDHQAATCQVCGKIHDKNNKEEFE